MSIVTPAYAKLNDLRPTSWVSIKKKNGDNNYLCVVDEDIPEIDDKNTFGKAIVCDKDYKFQPCPNMSKDDKQRIVYYISGQSGSGKTTMATEIAKVYKERFPSNKIIFISPKKPDGAMKELDPIIINISNEEKAHYNFVDEETKIRIEEDLDKTELDNTLCIFDDIEGVTKKIRLAIKELLNKILFLGRHRSISVCYLTHITCDHNETKPILTEANAIITFPNGKITELNKYVYKNYCGMDLNTVKALSNIKSRWICCHRNYPPFICTEKEFFLY